MTERKTDNKKERSKVKNYQVPFDLEVKKENLTVNSNTPSKLSKDQLIKEAFKFHSEGNISEASKYYQHFINQGFQDQRVFSNYGIILKGLGKLKEAELLTRKAIEIQSEFAEAHCNLGIILQDLGKLEEAALCLQKAIEIKLNFPEAHYNLGTILINLGKLKEAELSIRKAIELQPDFPKSFSNLGNILSNLGNLDEAEKCYRKAVELDPNYLEAHYNLGLRLKELGKFQEAELSLSKAIALKPNWKSYFFYAGCVFESKRFDEAINNLKVAKSLSKETKSKSLINAALKSIDLARNKSTDQTASVPSKNPKSLINKNNNKLILNLKRDNKLLSYLYDVKNRDLNNTRDARYGKGFCSENLNFFEDKSPIISNFSDYLKNICKKDIGLEEIIFCDSFFNIFTSGSLAGAKKHNHIGERDFCFGLGFRKYSLIYYLEVGDQSGEDPGKLKLYEPEEEILPINNMLLIINAKRNHSVSYCGSKDRVVISANFYGFS